MGSNYGCSIFKSQYIILPSGTKFNFGKYLPSVELHKYRCQIFEVLFFGIILAKNAKNGDHLRFLAVFRP